MSLARVLSVALLALWSVAWLIPAAAAADDVAPPTLVSFDFSPKAVDVTTGSRVVTVSARVTDASGVQSPMVHLASDTSTQTLHPDSWMAMMLTSGTATDGTWTADITVPTTATPGTWSVRLDPLRDTLGNYDNTATSPVHPTRLTVTNTPTTPPDTAGPAVSQFDFTPKIVDLNGGEKQVTVSVRLTDATGAEAPTIFLDSDSTNQTLGLGAMSRVSGTAQDGVYERTVTIPSTAALGTWTVTLYPTRDTLGNYGNNDGTGFQDHPTKLTVINTLTTPLDTDAPAVSQFDFSPKTVDINGGEKRVQVWARLTDATGAEAPTMVLDSDSTPQTLGFAAMSPQPGTPQNRVYAQTVTIPTTAAPGTWTVRLYPTRDTLGNNGAGFQDHPTKLTVTNTPPDTAAPAVSQFDFTPKTVDINGGEKQVTVSVRLTDATGAEAPTMVLDSDSTPQTLGFAAMSRVSGTAQDGVYERTVTIPTTSAPGTWSVRLYPTRDTLGNNGANFQDHPTKLTVTNDPAAGVPNPPTAVIATLGDGQANVSWTAPSGNGSPVIGYTVTSSPGGKTCTTTGATNCTVTGLTNGAAYTFTVMATNAIGNSPPSVASSSVTPAGVPTKPATPTASRGDGQANVSWTAPSGNGSPVIGYTVTSSPGAKTCTTTGATNCTVTGLTNGTAYTFTVMATNAVGTSPASDPTNSVTPMAEVVTPPPATTPTPTPTPPVTQTPPPGPPTSSAIAPSRMRAPRVVVRGSKAVVKWTAAAANGSAVVKYVIDVSKGTYKTTTGSARKAVVKGLSPGPYKIRIAAVNAVGASSFSPWTRIRIR